VRTYLSQKYCFRLRSYNPQQPPFPDADTNNRELNDAMPSFIPLLEERIGGDIVYKICDLVDGLTVKDTVDGVHPSLKVQQVIGKKLEEFIEKELYA